MANFVGNIAIANTSVKLGYKGIFALSGNKVYAVFHKTAVLGNIKAFAGSKTVVSGNTAVVKVIGQLFP